MYRKYTYPQIFIKLVVALAAIGLITFIPAGTIYWPEPWLFLGFYTCWAIPVLVWLKRHNPELLSKRLNWSKIPPKAWDKAVMISMIPSCFAIFIVAGLDFRYGWTQVPLSYKILGFVFFFISLLIIFRVMKENTFLSRVVEIQKENHHKVITTGPYKYVRHPMYVGALIFLAAIPLMLGSFYALIPSLVTMAGIVVRTILEDKTLHKELPEYKEYAQKTRYRLIPGIW